MAGNKGWGVSVIEYDGWRKGPWTAEEDRLLIEYVKLHGEGRWNSVARLAGLKRNGKSCRLRWVNYLRPDLKKGQITPQEESIILELHAMWGNRWSTIARSLPGRTDNEIKNYWRTHFKKKTKGPSVASDKAKNHPLRRQQFQLQQQQLRQQHNVQQQQQQQQQLQFNLEMKGVINLLEENNHSEPSISLETQEMVSMYPNTTEQQGYFYSMLNVNGNVSVPESSNEDFMWDGLWNLDDILCNFSAATATSKATLHNLVSPFC